MRGPDSRLCAGPMGRVARLGVVAALWAAVSRRRPSPNGSASSVLVCHAAGSGSGRESVWPRMELPVVVAVGVSADNPNANDRFCPDQVVTRGQMAAFLVRALGYHDGGGSDLFVDDDESVFESAIDELGTAGVTKGCNPPQNDRYCPNHAVTRAEMATFLTRALGLTLIVPPARNLIDLDGAALLLGYPLDSPAETVLNVAIDQFGAPSFDHGWDESICPPIDRFRVVSWDFLVLYMWNLGDGDVLGSFSVSSADMVPGKLTVDDVDLPDTVSFGDPYSTVAAQVPPSQAWTYDSLELDLVNWTTELTFVAQHSAYGTAPVDEAWVGSVPTCG